MKKVGVSEEEKRLSYYKYFEQPMAEIPQGKMDILNAGPSAPETALNINDKDLFLKGEYGNTCDCGYVVAADGTGFVANTTYMPGVTGEMLDWWFPWHSVGADLRYKIWDPEDHYFARADRADYVVDPAVPMAQKTWGVNHYILEDIGMGPEYLKLCFKRPKDIGYDESLIGTEQCTSLVCAVGEGNCPAVMTHKWRPYKDGVMFESRFWIGFGIAEGKLVKILPEGVVIPDIVPKSLFGHNIKEYTNLAAILPQVYAEQKEVF